MPPDPALFSTLHWLELSRTKFHGPKGVRAIQVRLYKFALNCVAVMQKHKQSLDSFEDNLEISPLFLNLNIRCDPSLEPSWEDRSNEGTQYMLNGGIIGVGRGGPAPPPNNLGGGPTCPLPPPPPPPPIIHPPFPSISM